MFDWSDGHYERTAGTLVRAAERIVAAAELQPGERVLDVGCGTGNAAIVAARAGARVTGIDPARRLVEIAVARAEGEGVSATFREGDALAIPFPDASFDVALSSFAVIFAPDPNVVASELARVVRPGGRFVVTSWVPEGALATSGQLLMKAARAQTPPSTAAPPPSPWGDPDLLRALFETDGARVTVVRESIVFEAASPEAWIDDQFEHHPAWRGVRRLISEDVFFDVRERTLEALRDANENPNAFAMTSGYFVTRVDRR